MISSYLFILIAIVLYEYNIFMFKIGALICIAIFVRKRRLETKRQLMELMDSKKEDINE